MNARETLRERILDALYEVAPEAQGQPLDDGAALRDQLDLDSVDLLRFMIALKARVGIDVPETDYPKLLTVGGCLDYFGARMAPTLPPEQAITPAHGHA